MLSFIQIQNLEHEIQEKKRQMRVLEQRIIENGEASIANASLVEMQQASLKSLPLYGYNFNVKYPSIVHGYCLLFYCG